MTDKEIIVCKFCGRSWEKEDVPHRKWIRKFIETVVATVAVAVTAIVLRWIGI
jgi:hypothetical protein